MSNSKIVYSTDIKVLSGQDQIKKNYPQVSQQKIRLHLDRKRGGKIITEIRGLVHDKSYLVDLTKKIKKQCGTGGTFKENKILIQGNKREIIKDILSKKGYNVKLSGG